MNTETRKKAKGLIDQGVYLVQMADKYQHLIKDDEIYIAKQFALKTVDSIIETLNCEIRDVDVRGNILLDLIDYYREVREEVENYEMPQL